MANVPSCDPCHPLDAVQIDLSVTFCNVFGLRCPIWLVLDLAMRFLLIAFTCAVVLAGTAQAQGVTCRDDTVLAGVNARALCAAHGGMPLRPVGPGDIHARHRLSRCATEDQAGRVHDRGGGQGSRGAWQQRDGVLLTAAGGL